MARSRSESVLGGAELDISVTRSVIFGLLMQSAVFSKTLTWIATTLRITRSSTRLLFTTTSAAANAIVLFRRGELEMFRRLTDAYLALDRVGLAAVQGAALGLIEAGLMSKPTMRIPRQSG